MEEPDNIGLWYDQKTDQNVRCDFFTRWSFKEEVYEAFGLEESELTDAILANMLSAAMATKAGRYTRVEIPQSNDTAHYRGELRKAGIWTKPIRAAMKILTNNNLQGGWLTRVDGKKGTAYTTYCPTKRLLHRAEEFLKKRTRIRRVGEICTLDEVLLKTQSGTKGVDGNHFERIHRGGVMTVRKMRKWLSGSKITFDSALPNSHVRYLYEDLVTGTAASFMRMFIAHESKGKTEVYGRFHHSLQWQLTKRQRKYIRINGEACCEIDVVSSQPRILYALSRVELQGDLYRRMADAAGVERSLAKVMMTYCIGSKGPSWHRYCTMKEIFDPIRHTRKVNKDFVPISKAEWDAMWGEIHPLAQQILAAGNAWEMLSNKESNWLERVMKRVLDMGEGLLPWHDSVVIPQRIAPQVHEIMEEEWRAVFGTDGLFDTEVFDYPVILPSPGSEIVDLLDIVKRVYTKAPKPSIYSINKRRRATVEIGVPTEPRQSYVDMAMEAYRSPSLKHRVKASGRASPIQAGTYIEQALAGRDSRAGPSVQDELERISI